MVAYPVTTLIEMLTVHFGISKTFKFYFLPHTHPPVLHLRMRFVQGADLFHRDDCHLLWNAWGLQNLAIREGFHMTPNSVFAGELSFTGPTFPQLFNVLDFDPHFFLFLGFFFCYILFCNREEALTFYFYLLFCSKKAPNSSTYFWNWFLSFSATCIAIHKIWGSALFPISLHF